VVSIQTCLSRARGADHILATMRWRGSAQLFSETPLHSKSKPLYPVNRKLRLSFV
jgi:hypothetical protein